MQANKILHAIVNADRKTIDDILDVAMKRKRELYPDWEIFYCAAPKESVSSLEEMVRKAWEFEQELKAKIG